MAALGILVHKHWCCSIFAYLCSCLLTSIGKSLLGIVYNQLFAKGIDKVLGASRDKELIWIGRCELDGITNLVSPQSATGRDDHRVVLTCFYAPKGYCIATIHRDELVEYIIIEHQ